MTRLVVTLLAMAMIGLVTLTMDRPDRVPLAAILPTSAVPMPPSTSSSTSTTSTVIATTTTLKPATSTTGHIKSSTTSTAVVSPQTKTKQKVLSISYSVSSRGQVDFDIEDFAVRAAKTYADNRGWSLEGSIVFHRVQTGGDFTLWLSEAKLLPSFSSDCSVQYSCTVGRNVVINVDRWKLGSPTLRLSVDEYRDMVVNHETGHWLGFGHSSCPGPGQPANIMQQQSKGGTFLGACTPNSWPAISERNILADRRGLMHTARVQRYSS